MPIGSASWHRRTGTRYREQMEGYARVMWSLDPRPIRMGLYFPLIQGWREWAFAEDDGPCDVAIVDYHWQHRGLGEVIE